MEREDPGAGTFREGLARQEDLLVLSTHRLTVYKRAFQKPACFLHTISRRIKNAAEARRIKNTAKAFGRGMASSDLEIGCFADFWMAYRKGSVDEEILRKSFDKDTFFSVIPEYQIQPYHTIIDIGAHIGIFSVLAASKTPNGNVYAVEACKESFNYLRVNAELNHATNLHARNLALSDRRGYQRLYDTDDNWGYSLTIRGSARGEEVNTESLESFMNEEHIETCHFLKCNCEGSEFPIFLTASLSTLRRIEFAVILCHCDIASGYTENDLENRLVEAGFSTAIRNKTEYRGWLIARRC